MISSNVLPLYCRVVVGALFAAVSITPAAGRRFGPRLHCSQAGITSDIDRHTVDFRKLRPVVLEDRGTGPNTDQRETVPLSLAFNSTGDHLLTGEGSPGKLCLWSLKTAHVDYTMRGYHGPVYHVLFSHDDRYIVGVDSACAVVWDATDRSIVAAIRPNGLFFEQCALSGDMELAASMVPVAGDLGRRCQAATCARCSGDWSVVRGACGLCTYSPDNRSFAIANIDGVSFVSRKSHNVLHRIKAKAICPVAFAHAAGEVVVGEHEGLSFYSTASWKCIGSVHASYPVIGSLGYCRKDSIVAVPVTDGQPGEPSGYVDLWDRRTCTLARRITFSDGVTAATVSRDGEHLAVASGNAVYLYRLSDVLGVVDPATKKR